MTKQKYLDELSKRLKHIPEVERENALNYYSEYIEDAGVDNIISTKEASSIIISEYLENSQIDNNISVKKSMNYILIAFLAILALPIGIPIAIVIFTLVTTVLACIVVIFLIVFALLILSLLIGCVFIISSFFLITANIPLSMIIAGTGLILLALSFIFIKLLFLIFKSIISLVIKFVNKYILRRS